MGTGNSNHHIWLIYHASTLSFIQKQTHAGNFYICNQFLCKYVFMGKVGLSWISEGKSITWDQGRIQPKVEGGQFGVGAPKRKRKVSTPKAPKNFAGFIQQSSLVFLLNSALVYVFPRIQNETLKKECIWVRIRGAFLAKKGVPKLSFHREGGQLPPLAPPKSATAWGRHPEFSCGGILYIIQKGI